jgi:hypothetical protein
MLKIIIDTPKITLALQNNTTCTPSAAIYTPGNANELNVAMTSHWQIVYG